MSATAAREAGTSPATAARIAARPHPRRRRALQLGIGLASVMAMIALFAPLLAPYDPTAVGELATTAYLRPSATHWFGTDEFGRDVLSRVLYGARVSLAIGGLSALLATGLGAMVGMLAGMRGGRVDEVLMRGVDLLLAIPRAFLVILVAGLVRPSLPVLILVLGTTAWMGTARIVRVEARRLSSAGFIAAARGLGVPGWRILLRHVLPNVASPLVVSATLMVGQTILAENALSFLGLGVQVPTPSWGAMVQEGRRVFPQVWWVSVFPGLVLTITVLACNLIGDALRDALDPRLAGGGGGAA